MITAFTLANCAVAVFFSVGTVLINTNVWLPRSIFAESVLPALGIWGATFAGTLAVIS